MVWRPSQRLTARAARLLRGTGLLPGHRMQARQWLVAANARPLGPIYTEGNVMHKTKLICVLAGVFTAGIANAQLADEFKSPNANCCLINTAKGLATQLQDWNQMGRFYAANQELLKQPADPKRVVFMGDSITDFWKLDQSFPGKPYVNRGIGGQTTPQMLARMYQDVINLKPAAMVVLAGTNDIANNTGPVTAAMVQENIMAMTELAQAHGIKVILCAVLPVSDYPFEKQQSEAGRAGARPAAAAGPGRGPMPRLRMTTNHPAADIQKMNSWMKSYAARVNAIYVDYYTATLDEKGFLKESLSSDGLHPNEEGYKVMVQALNPAIEKALR
jgi:acyl-CoA thioesterase I